MRASLWLLLGLLPGCLTVDPLAYDAVHCSQVTPETCSGNVWDRICVPCDEDYDWQRAFPFDQFPDMLAEGEEIRPIRAERVQRLRVTTEDGEGELDAYFIPSHGQVPAVADTTLVYHHGNGSLEYYLPRLQGLHELGYNVFTYDYRGFGKSDPATFPTAQQLLDDGRLLQAEARAAAPDPERLVTYGGSLGAIPAIEASLGDPGCALVLEVPFPGAQPATTDAGVRLPESYLSSGRWANPRKIEDYDGPLFLIAAEDDAFFSVEAVSEIFDRAPTADKERWVVPGAAHEIRKGGPVETGFTRYGDRLQGFLAEHAPDCLR